MLNLIINFRFYISDWKIENILCNGKCIFAAPGPQFFWQEIDWKNYDADPENFANRELQWYVVYDFRPFLQI